MKKTGYIFALVLLLNCAKSDPPGDTVSTTPVSLEYPDYFPDVIIPDDNPLTAEGIELGRKLYYDRLLGEGGPQDGKSCSSCHSQAAAFTSTKGIAVLPHINLCWNESFLWNGKIEGTMEDIMLFEVDDFFQANIQLLQSDEKYPDLFYSAFGTKTITSERTAKALAQFFRSMISTNSRFDQYMKFEVSLTPSELNGLDIFFTERGDCFHCHGSPLFSDNDFHNIGLDSIFTSLNDGRFTISNETTDIGKFKTPTLRNIELTGPYMHDDRFTTLAEVVDHYNTGVLHSSTLDPIMTKPGKETGLGLNPQEKADLVAFLKTLTDTTFTTNPKLSNPF